MENRFSFRPDGTFRLMQLTDTHFSIDPAIDSRTDALLRELIAEEKPDFIIHTGDAVYGPDSEAQLDLALAPLADSGIPWTFTFGNHDGEYLRNKEALFAHLQNMPGCVMWHDPASKDGLGNGWFSLNNEKGQTEWLLCCMDSGDYLPDERIGGYQYITAGQIQWYRDLMKNQEKKRPDFSAMVFMHIPLPEFEEVWRYETCYGMKRETVCSPKLNSGFFSALVEAGHTKGLFAGHDHVNDYWGALYGIALGYGRQSGYGNYGALDYPRGCRIFLFREGNTARFETWQRLSGGTVIRTPWVHHPCETRD